MWNVLSRLRLGQALAAVSALVALAGCGGGASDEPPLAPAAATLSARVGDCEQVPLNDSGHVLYIVLPTDCKPTSTAARSSAAASAGVGTDDRAVEIELIAPRAVGGSLSLSLSLPLREGIESGPVVVPGLGVRKVGLFRSGQWRIVEHAGTWSARDGAGLLVLGSHVYLLGGWLNGPVTNEVWRTSDLVHWEFLGHAPWPARHGAAWVVHKDRLWVIGGDLHTDVWSSPDGVQWTQHVADAAFGPRYTPNAASLNGKLVVYAGQRWSPVPWCHLRPDCTAEGDRSVWVSSDGTTWTRANDQAPWSGRGLIHGSLVHDGRIFLVGGGLKVAPPMGLYAETSAEFSDIWSTSDGVHWRRELERFSFPARTHFSVVSTPDGCYVSDGSVGTQDNLSHDLFHARDCVNYKPVATPAGLGNRHASSLVHFNGSLVLLGGPNYGGAGTTVWQYFP